MMMLRQDGSSIPKPKLSSKDVVCGRNAMAYSHSGNISFRKLIDKWGPTYQSTKERKTKRQITNEIIRDILEQGGRFLQVMEDPYRASIEHSSLNLRIVSEDFIYEKMSHALRSYRKPTVRQHNRPDSKKRVSPTESSGSSLPGTVNEQDWLSNKATPGHVLGLDDVGDFGPYKDAQHVHCRADGSVGSDPFLEEKKEQHELEPLSLQSQQSMDSWSIDPDELQELLEGISE